MECFSQTVLQCTSGGGNRRFCGIPLHDDVSYQQQSCRNCLQITSLWLIQNWRHLSISEPTINYWPNLSIPNYLGLCYARKKTIQVRKGLWILSVYLEEEVICSCLNQLCLALMLSIYKHFQNKSLQKLKKSIAMLCKRTLQLCWVLCFLACNTGIAFFCVLNLFTPPI